ncbi:response regulator [uncultured Flavobacterium sp.]|uniref:response regulator n=1 Tax=uncultured Flavobacterium sp. TaxID=165435 RepID=UPI0030ED4A06|tara:strand:- start:121711 stop:122142 length:432 start_codon:yes stop_codon:yes gene_type:complete
MKEKIGCILLVDDDEMVNCLNTIRISKAGIADEIEPVLNGQKALEFLTSTGQFVTNVNSTTRPLLIVLDINMPVMDGWEFIEEYQKTDVSEKDKIIIVMHTTSTNPADQLRAESIPEISSFTKKPLTQELLNTIMNNHFPELL